MNIRLAILYLMLMISFCTAAVGSATAAPPAATDPKPPQVTVNFIFPPSPLIQHGMARLVYEMVITNYVPTAYTLESIEVDAGPKKFSYSGDALKEMTRPAGEAPPSAQSRKLEGGRTVVVFFTLDFKHASDIPRTLSHTLHVKSSDGAEHTWQPSLSSFSNARRSSSRPRYGVLTGSREIPRIMVPTRRIAGRSCSTVGERLLLSVMRSIGYVIGWSMA